MIAIVKKVQVKAEAFLTNLVFPKFKTISEGIVILSSYCSRGDEKTFGWASMILMSHLSFVQCEQTFSKVPTQEKC